MTENVILILYGLFFIGGGYLGYRKGSKISLVTGIVFGVLIFAGTWFLSVNAQQAWIFLASISGLLSVVMFIRLMKTYAFMPSGMLLAISLTLLAFCFIHL